MPTEKNTLSIYSFRANSRKNRTELLKNADFYLRFFEKNMFIVKK